METVANPDLQIRGGGENGRPDPEIRGGLSLQNIFLGPSGLSLACLCAY